MAAIVAPKLHLQAKRISGQTYYYAVRMARVGGRPRKVEQVYLGKVADLVAARHQQTEPKSVRTRRFGAVAALWALSESLGLRAEIDRQCANRQGPGASLGTYLVLAAINRVVEPRSKNRFAEWYASTSLARIVPLPPAAITSQAFWTAMDRFPLAAGMEILTRLTKPLLQACGDTELVAFDCTNFFTFIASTNGRSTLARRGHNKAKRHDLRQVGLALAASSPHHLPLFYHLYSGEQPDVKVFKAILPELHKTLVRLELGQATLVYDKGNLSKANQQLVDESGLHYVTAVPPHLFPDLLAIPLSRFTAATSPKLGGFLLQREERRLWSRDRVLVQSYSPELAAGQLGGVQQHLAKAKARLAELQASLRRRRQPKAKGRKPTRAGIEIVVAQILEAQHLRQLITVAIHEVGEGFELEYRMNDEAFEHLRQHLFGRRIWVSDRQDGSAEQIVEMAHQQNEAEACFRQLHGDEPVAWSPMWHWTDQKVAVHGFYMILALLLLQQLMQRARQAGDDRGSIAVLDELNRVDECLLVYPAAGQGKGRPRLVTKLSECSPQQQQLLEATNALAFAPTS